MTILCECGEEGCWGECYERRACEECGQNHIRTRCKGACRRTMCVNNPHTRFYCPRCSEVHCGVKRQGDWIVLPHYRVNVDSITANAQLMGHQSVVAEGNTRPCRGGPIDYTKDRAP